MRCRVSVDLSVDEKKDIVDHGFKLGVETITGSLRLAILRSSALINLQRRGTLFFQDKKDGSMVEVPDHWWY